MTKKAVVKRYNSVDIPSIVELIMEEVPKLPNYKGINLARDRIEFMLKNNVVDESAFMVYTLVDDKGSIVGCIAAYCVTQLLSWDKSTGDIFLFVKEENRTIHNAIALIKSYVDWAHRRGAKIIQATLTSGYRPEEMDRLMKVTGFERIGTLYRQTSV